MKKIIVILCLLVVIISSISFVACDKKEQENEPLYLSAFGDFVTDPDNEVVSLEFVDVPDEIKIGYFKDAGIKLKVTYMDGGTRLFKVEESIFQEDEMLEFVRAGDKYFDFLYKGNHVPLKFKLVEPAQRPQCVVIYEDRMGGYLDSEQVMYMAQARGVVREELDYIEGDKYYKFVGWNRSLSHVYENMIVSPKYEIYTITASLENAVYRDVIYGYKDSDDNYHMLMYAGRFMNVPVCYYDAISRTDYISQDVNFATNSSYNSGGTQIAINLGNELLKDRFNYTMTSSFSGATISGDGIMCMDFSVGFGELFIWNQAARGYGSVNVITRKDGKMTPIYNILDADAATDYVINKYNSAAQERNIHLNQDSALGVYGLSLNYDIDLFFDLVVTKTGDNDYNLEEVKVMFSLAVGTDRFDSIYSKDGNINSKGNILEMSSDEIASAIHSYIVANNL